ncbi:MAG: capsular biosynthesis protein [Salinivirgaceae bacterium]|nr:MAG: capsular biosynthesis protein [Salinivirgaceae bacterium]
MLGLFRSNKNKINLEGVGVDMHSHLIPGIDDGVKSIEESIQSIKLLHEIGYTHIVTTPHIMSDYYPNTPQIIKEGLEKVRLAVQKEGIPIKIDAAAEYYIDYQFYTRFEEAELLTINNRFILFELSFLNPPEILKDIIFKMQTAGYIPILAHPERYSYWFRNFNIFKELKDRGVWMQVNINSFADEYGVPTRKLAEKLVKEDMVDLIGSDFHRPQHIEVMRMALRNKCLQKFITSGKMRNKELFA